jgi:glycerol uptake facilitator-like aquaporin
MKLWRAIAGECIGTAALAFVACGADVISEFQPSPITPIVRAAAPALVLTALIWSLSGVSGAHLNPAVTLAFVLRERFPIGVGTAYAIAQLAGAMCACLLLALMFGNVIAAAPHPREPFSDWQAFAAETAGAFLLVFTILATAEQKGVVGKNVAMAVGGVLAACTLIFLPISGAAFNQARALAPMIVSGDVHLALIYLFAPFVGSVLAVLAARVCLG